MRSASCPCGRWAPSRTINTRNVGIQRNQMEAADGTGAGPDVLRRVLRSPWPLPGCSACRTRCKRSCGRPVDSPPRDMGPLKPSLCAHSGANVGVRHQQPCSSFFWVDVWWLLAPTSSRSIDRISFGMIICATSIVAAGMRPSCTGIGKQQQRIENALWCHTTNQSSVLLMQGVLFLISVMVGNLPACWPGSNGSTCMLSQWENMLTGAKACCKPNLIGSNVETI